MVSKTLPWAESLLRAQGLQRKQQQSSGKGKDQNLGLTPPWALNDLHPDGSLMPSSIHPHPQAVPLCLAASGLQRSLLPPLCQSSCATEAVHWLCLPAWHTPQIQTSPAHWKTRKEMLVKRTAIFGWFPGPKVASLANSPLLQQGMGFPRALHSLGRHQESQPRHWPCCCCGSLSSPSDIL